MSEENRLPDIPISLQEKVKLPNEERLFWHGGFYGAIELDLRQYKQDLGFHAELKLGNEAPRLDELVIVKKPNILVDEDFGKLFRMYNVVEYKSEEDELNIDELFNVAAYAFRFKGLGKKVDAIPANEVTISLFRRSYPRELMKKLEDYGFPVTQEGGGIYYVHRFAPFPTQIVVMKDIDKRHCALRALGKDISEDEARDFSKEIKGLRERDDKRNAKAAIDVSLSANRELYNKVWKENGNMNHYTLMDVFADEINARAEKQFEAWKKTYVEDERNVIFRLVRDGDMELDKAAKRVGKTPAVFCAEMQEAGYQVPMQP